VHGLEADLHLKASLRDGRLEAQVSRISSLHVEALDPDWPPLALLPEDTRQALRRDLALSLPAIGDRGLRVAAERTEEGLAVSLDGPLVVTAGEDMRLRYAGRLDVGLSPDFVPRSLEAEELQVSIVRLPLLGYAIDNLSLGGSVTAGEEATEGKLTLVADLAQADAGTLELHDVSLSMPVSLSAREGGIELALWGPGRVTAGQAILGTDVLLRESLSLDIQTAELSLEPDGSWRHSLTAKAAALSLALPSDAGPAVAKELVLKVEGGVEDGDYRGQAGVLLASLHLSDLGLRLADIRVETPLPPGRLSEKAGRIEIGSAAVAADGQDFARMSFAGDLTRAREGYRLKGQGRGPGGRGGLAVSLVFDPDRGSGNLKAHWGPISFQPDGLQPKALSSELEGLERVSGQVELNAEMSWTAKSSSQSARVRLTDIDATMLPLEIEGLDGDLHFSSLAPLASAGEQTLVIDRLEVGVPLEQVILPISIDEGGGIAVGKVQAGFAGGQLSTSPFLYDPTGTPVATTLEITHVKLDRLSDLLDLGDVQLEGRVIGQLPLTVDPEKETLAIKNGWLQAVGEGVIRIPDAATRLGLGDVSQQQKQFLFALEALDDFRYTYLYSTVNFGAGGELDLTMTLEGNNPAVQQGYPFKFNITFSVDLGEVLKAVRLGRSITPELFDGAWSLK